MRIQSLSDRFSKMAHFVPLSMLSSAKETAQLLLNHVFYLHGIPLDEVSDGAPSSLLSSSRGSADCSEPCPACHLASTLSPMARLRVTKKRGQPRGALCPKTHPPGPSSCYGWNIPTLISSATGLSPFQFAYRHQPPLFSALEREASCPTVQAFLHRCRRTWAQARASLLKAADRYSSSANRHCSQATGGPDGLAFQPRPSITGGVQQAGSQVHRIIFHLTPSDSHRMINPVGVRLKLPKSMRVHPTFHVSRVKPVLESSLVPAAPPPSPPRFIDGGLAFTVRHIIRSCVRG